MQIGLALPSVVILIEAGPGAAVGRAPATRRSLGSREVNIEESTAERSPSRSWTMRSEAIVHVGGQSVVRRNDQSPPRSALLVPESRTIQSSSTTLSTSSSCASKIS